MANEWKFQPNSIIYIIGPTGSGKSEFIKQLLANNASMLSAEPGTRLNMHLWYGMYSNFVQHVAENFPEAKLHEGLNYNVLDNLEETFKPQPDSSGLHNLIICDDLGPAVGNCPQFNRLITMGVHHLQITVIIVCHRLFEDGKYRKLQMENANYFVIFKSLRALDSLVRLATQLSLVSTSLLKFAFADICKQDYTPLVLDIHKSTDPDLCLVSSILPHQFPVVAYLSSE